MRLEAPQTKAPSSKLQAPEKLQSSSSKPLSFVERQIGAWNLKFLWSLDVGAWCFGNRPKGQQASVLIMVLWIAFGLVSLALYFASSMTFEMRAAENRVSALQADAAIDGASRYLT